MTLIFATLSKSALQHWLKSLFVFIALVIGIAGLSSVLVINSTAKQQYANATPAMFTQLQFRITAKPGHTLDKQDYADGRRRGLDWVPVAEYSSQLASSDEVTILAVDPFAMPLAQHGVGDASTQLPGSVLIQREFARSMGVEPGDALQLSDGTVLGNAVIVSQGLQEGLLLMDIADFMTQLHHPEVDELWLFTTPYEAQLSRLKQRFQVESVVYEDPATLTDSFHLNLLAMGLLMFIVCLFIVMNAFHLLYTDRQAMFIVLRQMGVSRLLLLQAIALELLLLCLLSSVVGMWLGIQLAQWLSPAVELTLTSLYELDISLNQSNLLSLFVLSFVACLAGAIMATLNPLLSLNQQLANIKAQVNNSATYPKLWWYAALLFAVAFILCSLFAKSLVMHFVAVACLILLGCTLVIILVPILLKWIASLISPKRALLHWSALDSVRIARKSNIAICAFFIAVTANVGMNLMVDSFRQATTVWLEQRLVADYYVSTDEPQQVIDYFANAHPDLWLWQRKRLNASLAGTPVDVVAYPTDSEYQNALGLKYSTENAWQHFQKDGVFINEQLAFREQLQPGQEIQFFADNQLFTRTVVGIHYDYGNMDKQILMPDTQITGDDSERFLFAVHAPGDYSVDLNTITQQVKQRDPSAFVSDLQQIMHFSMVTFDKAFVVTGALNIITLLVAGASLATSISLIETQNSGPSGLMRALGVSKWQLTGYSLGQYSLLALLAALIAIPFGATLSYLLINKINVASFAWSYPLLFNAELIARVVVMSVVIVVCAVLLPLWYSQRKTIGQRLAEQ